MSRRIAREEKTLKPKLSFLSTIDVLPRWSDERDSGDDNSYFWAKERVSISKKNDNKVVDGHHFVLSPILVFIKFFSTSVNFSVVSLLLPFRGENRKISKTRIWQRVTFPIFGRLLFSLSISGPIWNFSRRFCSSRRGFAPPRIMSWNRYPVIQKFVARKTDCRSTLRKEFHWEIWTRMVKTGLTSLSCAYKESHFYGTENRWKSEKGSKRQPVNVFIQGKIANWSWKRQFDRSRDSSTSIRIAAFDSNVDYEWFAECVYPAIQRARGINGINFPASKLNEDWLKCWISFCRSVVPTSFIDENLIGRFGYPLAKSRSTEQSQK